MNELYGNSIQIILSIKEGVGFNFVHTPIVVSCSLNGHVLESDPVPARQTSIIDSELVWETEKRAFRSLRLQNVPLKVEVWTTGARERKERIGYLLLSLLAAKPRPSHKRTTVNHSWHKLLGVKPEGKSCDPQMLLRLTIEDFNRSASSVTHSSTPTSNKTRNSEPGPASSPSHRSQGYIKPNPLSLEKQKLDLSPHLVPSLRNDGSIQIGGDSCTDLFQLCLNIQSSENIHLLSDRDGNSSDMKESYYIQWVIFTQTLKTAQGCLQNQQISLTARSDLTALSHFFRESPYAIIKLYSHGKEIGACCVDLRKMIPSDSIPDFLTNFCNASKTFICNERCFVVSCTSEEIPCDSNGKKPYLDMEISIRYMNPDEKIVTPIKEHRNGCNESPFCLFLDIPETPHTLPNSDISKSNSKTDIVTKESSVTNKTADSKTQSESNSPSKVIDQNGNITKRLSIAESDERISIIVKENELASKVLKTENDIAAILKQMEILISASPTKKCFSVRDASEIP